MKVIRFLFLSFFGCTTPVSHGNSIDKLPRMDNYLAKFVIQSAALNCYCSTQNEFDIPLTINKKLYPYRGEFADASNEILHKDRIKKSTLDSLNSSWNISNYQSSYYSTFWDPEAPNQKKKLVDIIITRLFNSEVDMEFTDSGIDTVSGEIGRILIPDQRLNIMQFGKITSYPNLKSHWHHIAKLDTKIAQRDLGIYSQITHFFIWSGKTYSVTFNFDHNPTHLEMNEIHQFFLHLGERCILKDYTRDQLRELDQIMRKYYKAAYELLYAKLSEAERQQVISCTIEKLGQVNTFDEISTGAVDGDVIDESTMGCIEFIKL